MESYTLFNTWRADLDLNFCHVDMDAFFASVEERDNPKFKNIPMAVGGLSNRGVLTTANYVARKYGLHSAMPVFIARKICPQVIILEPRMDLYKKISREIFELLKKYSTRIEKISIDEAYLDISNNNIDPLELAREIKKDVFQKTKLTISVGISYNKFLAKMASDWNKPDGIKIIRENEAENLLKDLDIEKIHGIGKQTAKRLNYLGIHKVTDMLNLSKDYLYQEYGKYGLELFDRIRGRDSRQIECIEDRKSLGIERTLKQNLSNRNEINAIVHKYCSSLVDDLKNSHLQAKTISLKFKYDNFKQLTRSHTLIEFTNDEDTFHRTVEFIFSKIDLKNPVRLIGISASNLIDDNIRQKTFF